MWERLHRLPSPAMAVAFLALLGAIGGTAVALPGKNSVKKDDIARGAVGNSDIAKNAITARKVKNRSITGRKLRLNSVGGGAVKESSLGKVPSAGSADSASTANSANTAGTAGFANSAGNANTVGGRSVERVVRFLPDGTAETPLFTKNGLTVLGSCSAGNEFDVNATTSVENSSLYFFGIDTDSDGVAGDDFESGEFDLGVVADIEGESGDGDADTAQGPLDYFQPDANVGVHMDFILDEVSGGCLFVATATS